MPLDAARPNRALNVLGGTLETCSLDPMTGFTRTGCCETGPDDLGSHTVCAEVTAEFLAFSRSRGNDLSTARPEYGFPGLQPGDRWCLCASRWHEAFLAGCARVWRCARPRPRRCGIAGWRTCKATPSPRPDRDPAGLG